MSLYYLGSNNAAVSTIQAGYRGLAVPHEASKQQCMLTDGLLQAVHEQSSFIDMVEPAYMELHRRRLCTLRTFVFSQALILRSVVSFHALLAVSTSVSAAVFLIRYIDLLLESSVVVSTVCSYHVRRGEHVSKVDMSICPSKTR